MASNGFGDEVTVRTHWVGEIQDSVYFKSPVYARYREPGNIKYPCWLQPVKYYRGVAWYRKTVDIPASWRRHDIQLFLERCHWETRLWVDDKEVGMRNHLGAPHVYDLSDVLTPGRHTLTLRVDNDIRAIDPGVNSHSISDHTQGNWNGVVGEMCLQVRQLVNISQTKIYPDVHGRAANVEFVVKNRKTKALSAVLTLNANGKTTRQNVVLQPGDNRVAARIELGSDAQLWDEFNPKLYTLEATVGDTKGHIVDRHSERFGLREIKVENRHITVNGRQVFLRGALDCAAFPKTGYPPTDKASWLKILGECRAHGLNHVRYHSWCPPEAAFEAADELGMYLEIECSSWANQSTTIGDGRPLDKFIQEESDAIVDAYGNHPSFCMMMYGNEPAGEGSSKYLNNFTAQWKKRDNRRIYCSSAGWPDLPASDFFSSSSARIQRWGEGLRSIINAKAPNTMFDFSAEVGSKDRPVVSHEIGQWCVYPNFKEMKKYRGVMRAKNFEIFQESLREHGMQALADSFLLASGKLQTLCYKADIEAALRTKDFGGFQLLGLSDFPGQGTALVGVLDAFWEEKGYTKPAEYREFCNSIVPLVRLPKMIYLNNERLEATVEVANFGKEPLRDVTASWKLFGKDGHEVDAGKWNVTSLPIGNCLPLGKISAGLSAVSSPECLTLEVTLGSYTNKWHIWVYPSDVKTTQGERGIYMTDRLDAKAERLLANGGSVLLSLKKGTLANEYGGKIPVGFSSIFWNTAWTHKQPPHTLGILCNPKHPALAAFPTEYYSDYQWWDAMSHSGAVEFTKLSANAGLIVRVIDDWFTNRPLALLFELKVGRGKLLVSGIDFWNGMDKRPEARQLLHSLTQYMASRAFNPSAQASVEQVKEMVKTK